MVKLCKLLVKGFKNPNKTVEITFSEGNTSIIYGDNGSGKTTLLNILFAVFSQDDKKLNKENIHEIIVSYMNNSSILQEVKIIKRDEIKQMKLLNEDGEEQQVHVRTDGGYNWEDFEDSELVDLKSMFFGVQRGIQTQYFSVSPGDLFNFFRNPRNRELLNIKDSRAYDSISDVVESLTEYLNRRSITYRNRLSRKDITDLDRNHVILENINIQQIEEQIIDQYQRAKFITSRKIQNALFDTFSQAIDNNLSLEDDFPDDYEKLLSDNADRLVEALRDSQQNPFIQRIVDILQKKEIISTDINDNLLKNLIYNMIKEIELEKLFLDSVNILFKTYNEHLCDNKQVVIENNEIFVKVGKDRHSINNLSSGERHLLTFLAFVLIDGRERDFLIIDEPEISLNSKWQRTLIPLLAEIAPNTQIIVASHSPSIAKYDPSALVEIIKLTE